MRKYTKALEIVFWMALIVSISYEMALVGRAKRITIRYQDKIESNEFGSPEYYAAAKREAIKFGDQIAGNIQHLEEIVYFQFAMLIVYLIAMVFMRLRIKTNTT